MSLLDTDLVQALLPELRTAVMRLLNERLRLLQLRHPLPPCRLTRGGRGAQCSVCVPCMFRVV